MTNVPIVMYHSINDAVDDKRFGRLAFTTRQFRQHLKCFRDAGFRCITLDELHHRACHDELQAGKFAVLTFDDGFFDNWALARDILSAFDAHGTVFVNPDQTSIESKDRSAVTDHWGRLSYPELIEMERDGTLTVQSHTMTHDFTFCSDRVVDFFSWEKRNKYYWLGFLLFPEEKTQWVETFDDLQRRIPEGYPIFEYERTLMAPIFRPHPDFIDRCVKKFSKDPDGADKANQFAGEKGRWEIESDYRDRVRHIIGDSKRELEERLSKEIVAVCFPGGGYNDFALACAKEAGFRQYIFSSRDPGDRDNRQRLAAAANQSQMIGLRRLSFTTEQPAFLKNDLCEYLNCKWHLDLFLERPYAKPLMQLGKRAKSLLKLW